MSKVCRGALEVINLADARRKLEEEAAAASSLIRCIDQMREACLRGRVAAVRDEREALEGLVEAWVATQ